MSEELKTYKCPNCNGAISFDAHSQQLVCPSCGTSLNVDDVIAFNQIDGEQAQDHFDWDDIEFPSLEEDGMVTYVCDACGGEIIGDHSLASSSCPYCGNHVIIEKQFQGLLKPNYILPFKYDKDEAKKKMKEHLKGKPLLPKSFTNNFKLSKISGLYVPYWLFDCEATASFKYRAERSTTYRQGDYLITNVDHYLLYREGYMDFSKVPVDGSSKLEAEVLEAIEPFDFSELKPFKAAYLQGYLSDRFDADAKSAKPRANERIRNSITEEIAKTTTSYQMVVPTQAAVSLNDNQVAYALLPVWILHTQYKGKDYRFAMNAQTGKFVGDLPIDYKKFVLIVLMTFVITALVVGLFMYFSL